MLPLLFLILFSFLLLIFLSFLFFLPFLFLCRCSDAAERDGNSRLLRALRTRESELEGRRSRRNLFIQAVCDATDFDKVSAHHGLAALPVPSLIPVYPRSVVSGYFSELHGSGTFSNVTGRVGLGWVGSGRARKCLSRSDKGHPTPPDLTLGVSPHP